MDKKAYRLIQSLVVSALAVYIFVLLVQDKLKNYIHQRFTYLIVIALVLLIAIAVLGFISLRRMQGSATKQANFPLLILAIPIVFGFFVPSKPLSTEALQSKGISQGVASQGVESNSSGMPDPEDRTILDWVRLLYFEKNNPSFIGEPAKVIGFVHHDARLADNQFVIARFVVSCCLADASAIAMVIEPNELEIPPKGVWVEVTGKMDVIEVDGEALPMIRESTFKQIPIPDQPYLYP